MGLSKQEAESAESPYFTAYVEFNGKAGLDHGVSEAQFIDITVQASRSRKHLLATQLRDTVEMRWDEGDESIFFLGGPGGTPFPRNLPEVQDLLLAKSAQRLTAEQLLDLSKRSAEVKRAVASRPRLPVTVQRALVHDPDPVVRLTLAERRSLPLELKLELAHDPDEAVRRQLARGAVPRRLCDVLSRDPRVLVRLTLASNHNSGRTYKEGLARLLHDRSSRVREAAKRTLAKLD